MGLLLADYFSLFFKKTTSQFMETKILITSMKKDNIPGYPGHYLNRKGTLWRFKNGEWIKVKRYISPKGYPHVHLYKC